VEKIRKVNFLFLLGFLLSLGVVDFSTAQWESFSPEVRRWEIDVESGQFWPVYRDRVSLAVGLKGLKIIKRPHPCQREEC